ncbi:MAG: hypothetical protein ACXIT9_07010 [Nitritalea sp.]
MKNQKSVVSSLIYDPDQQMPPFGKNVDPSTIIWKVVSPNLIKGVVVAGVIGAAYGVIRLLEHFAQK